jgi:uncharacterized protein YjbI with pentapeptide repeats
MFRDGLTRVRRSAWLRVATRSAIGVVALSAAAQLAVQTASADPRCMIVPNPTETHHTDCPGKDLTNIGWAHTHLEWANLAGANLTDAHLKDAHLDHANLSHADLTNAHMEQSFLTYTDFSFATLRSRPTDLNGPLLQMEGAHMFMATLNGANIDYAIWTGTDLTKAKLRGATVGAYFSQTTLTGADLTNAWVSSTTWQAAVLKDVTFCHTWLYGVGYRDDGCPRNRAVARMEAPPILRGPGRIVVTGQINRLGIRGVAVYCKNNSYVESADDGRGRTILGQPLLNLLSRPAIVTSSSSPLTSLALGQRGKRLATGIHLQFYPAANTRPRYPVRFKAIVFCTPRRPDAWQLAGRRQ